MSDTVLFVIQRFDRGEWIIQDVKEGDSADWEVKKLAADAYTKAIEWDANMPVRLVAYYGKGDDRNGPIRILNHQPENPI